MALTNVPLSLLQVRGHSSATSATAPSRERTRSTSTSRWCTTAIRSTSVTCVRRPLSLRPSSRATRRWMKRAWARRTSIIDAACVSAGAVTLSPDWVQAAFLPYLSEHNSWNHLHFQLQVKLVEKYAVFNQTFHHQSSALTLNLKGKKWKPAPSTSPKCFHCFKSSPSPHLMNVAQLTPLIS